VLSFTLAPAPLLEFGAACAELCEQRALVTGGFCPKDGRLFRVPDLEHVC
jgi:hypothetical protein